MARSVSVQSIVLGFALSLSGGSALARRAPDAPAAASSAKAKPKARPAPDAKSSAKPGAKSGAKPDGKQASPAKTGGPKAGEGAAPVAGPAAGKQAPADAALAAVERIQKFYESTSDLHARFEQELGSGLGGRKKASGEVWLKKPGKMRWEYARPEKKLMIADGKSLWVYEPEDEQAFRQDLTTSALPSSVTFLFGTGKLTDEFTVSLDPGDAIKPAVVPAGSLLLKLVPRQPTAQYRFIYFLVDGSEYRVEQSWVHDQQGGVNHLTFKDVKTNSGVTDAKFEFTPPPGTRILKP